MDEKSLAESLFNTLVMCGVEKEENRKEYIENLVNDLMVTFNSAYLSVCMQVMEAGGELPNKEDFKAGYYIGMAIAFKSFAKIEEKDGLIDPFKKLN